MAPSGGQGSPASSPARRRHLAADEEQVASSPPPSEAEVRVALCDLAAEVHVSVREAAARLWKERRRRYYVTPRSYLELLSLFEALLAEQRAEVG